MRFLKKSACGFLRLSLEPTSPAAQRCTNGAPDGPKRKRQSNETQNKIERMQAGRAKQVTAHLCFICLTLFEIAGY